METVTAPDGGITRYAYDDANRPTEARLPNGVRTRTIYDQRDRVTHIEQDLPANPAVPASYIDDQRTAHPLRLRRARPSAVGAERRGNGWLRLRRTRQPEQHQRRDRRDGLRLG